MRPTIAVPSFVLGLVLTLSGSPARAQVDPTWDHYKFYTIIEAAPGFCPPSFTIVDQFDSYSMNGNPASFFANPVEKIADGTTFPINDARTHYAIYDGPFGFPSPVTRSVVVENQFGQQTINVVVQPVLLMIPALKNEVGPLPNENHYVCHQCTGLPVNRSVILTDQFTSVTTMVLEPMLLCNPAVVTPEGGPTFPIVEPRRHQVFYRISNPGGGNFSATYIDEATECFGPQFFSLFPGGPFGLAVPSEKFLPVSIELNTWGGIKSLYR